MRARCFGVIAMAKLDDLLKKRDQLNAQIQAAKAREQGKKRKLETRAKVILGGVMMKLARNDEKAMQRLKVLIAEQVTRESDQKTFIELGLISEHEIKRKLVQPTQKVTETEDLI